MRKIVFDLLSVGRPIKVREGQLSKRAVVIVIVCVAVETLTVRA